jgi:2-polyprenyl-3-methyl-5-hydroxy-6-metoxy-1,4-benzoquinol methylase
MRKQVTVNNKVAINNYSSQIKEIWQLIVANSDNFDAWKDLRMYLSQTKDSESLEEQVIACINCYHMDAMLILPIYQHKICLQLNDSPLVIPPILLAFLKKIIVANAFVENCLLDIRRNEVVKVMEGDFNNFNSEYIEAISMQCFLNEYAYPCRDNELAAITQLTMASIKYSLGIKLLSHKTKCLLMLASCYFPLFDIFIHHPGLLELCQQSNFSPLILKMQVENILTEQKIKHDIVTISTIEDDISLMVQDQYEKYPYPRWHSAEIVHPRLSFYPNMNKNPYIIPINLENAKMLIAGCGTGKHILNSHNPGFQITAIDLSRASLAYAIRNCLEYGFNNIEFYQADILNLEKLAQQYDIIESCGVLHHTRSIDESFGELHKKLKANGIFFLALYSTAARAYLENIRTIIKERGYKPELQDIRKIREAVLANLHNDFNRSILRLNDFFTSSMLIDLLFHCNEITSNIDDIKNLIAKYNMKFIKFVFSDDNIKTAYLNEYPEDPELHSLDNWQQFEKDHPETFIGMYQFVLQKM